MPRGRLKTVAEIKRFVDAGAAGDFAAGCLCRGSLSVRVWPSGAVTWVYRVKEGGKSYVFGVGSYESVSLKEARERAAVFAANPAQAKADKQAGAAAKAKPMNCGAMFADYVEWERGRGTWGGPNAVKYRNVARRLERYAAPVIGAKDAADISAADIALVLNRVKADGKHSTAAALKNNLSCFFKWCILVRGCRPEAAGNPARGEALSYRLVQAPDGPAHHRPMARIEDLPRFFRLVIEARKHDQTVGAACLFAILTASRFANVARQPAIDADNYVLWDEVDLDAAAWIIPAHKMKCPKNGDHVVPLAWQAVTLLRRLEPLGLKRDGAVFQTKAGRPFCRGAIYELIRRIADADLKAGGNGFIDPRELDASGKPCRMTLHGTARGTFQSWGARNGKPHELLEKALHHTAGSVTEAYQRDPMAQRRRELMQEWADYCFSECPSGWDALP